MKSSYKLCTSEAEIFYKDDKNTEVVKSQKSNISETIVYGISLIIFHDYSIYNYYQYAEKVGHSINIKNKSTMTLNDVHILITIKNCSIYNLELLGLSKPFNYYRSKNSISIEVKSLIPMEELYIKLAGYPYYYRPDFNEIGKVQINAKIMGLDGNFFFIGKTKDLSL